MDTPEAQRFMLIELAKNVIQLFHDRDDLVIGVTAALLDLYRMNFENGSDSKSDAVARLRAQLDFLRRESPDERGALYLKALLDTLEQDKLDAARLIREIPKGTA